MFQPKGLRVLLFAGLMACGTGVSVVWGAAVSSGGENQSMKDLVAPPAKPPPAKPAPPSPGPAPPKPPETQPVKPKLVTPTPAPVAQPPTPVSPSQPAPGFKPADPDAVKAEPVPGGVSEGKFIPFKPGPAGPDGGGKAAPKPAPKPGAKPAPVPAPMVMPGPAAKPPVVPPPRGLSPSAIASPVMPPPAGNLPPPLPDMGFLDFKPGFGEVLSWEPGEFPEPLSNQAVLEADKVDQREKVGDVRAEGNAWFRYRELSMSSPLLYYHEPRELVHAKGGAVKLDFRGHKLEAEELYVDFRAKNLKARNDVMLLRRQPKAKEAPEDISPSAGAVDEGGEEEEEPLVTALKKRTTQMFAGALDLSWEKGEETMSASGGVVIEQPKWLLVSQRLRANDRQGTLSAVGDVVLTLSDSRWLIEEEVLPATALSEALQDEPVTVKSPQMDYDRDKGITYLHGPVLMEMPKKRLRARSVTVNEKENQVFFDAFDYEQQESRWLIERGVISSVPDRIDAQLDRPMTALAAKAVYYRSAKRLVMEGGVQIRQGAQWLKADRLIYDEAQKRVELFGRAEVHDENTKEFLKGELLVYNEESGRFEATGRVRINVKAEETEDLRQ